MAPRWDKMDYDTDKPRISKLTGVNYRTWEIQVGRMLKAQGLYGAISGKFRKVLKNAATQYTAEDNATDDESDDTVRVFIDRVLNPQHRLHKQVCIPQTNLWPSPSRR